MKKKLLLVIALVCLIGAGLSACSHKECPPCQTSLGQAQYTPQATAMPAEESRAASRRASIK